MKEYFQEEMLRMEQAIKNNDVKGVRDLLESVPEVVGEINGEELVTIWKVRDMASMTNDDFRDAKKSQVLQIIKILIDSGVKYEFAKSRGGDAIKNAYRQDFKDVFIYLVKHYLKEFDGDFRKLKSSYNKENFFTFLNSAAFKSRIFLEIIKEFPELIQPLAIDPIFFKPAEEASSRSISDAASFNPVKALDGNGLQVSIAPSSELKKKTIIISKSFFDYTSRQLKQIRRLIIEGFSVLIFDGKDNFIELTRDCDESIFAQAAEISFTQKSEKYSKILERDFSLPKNEILLLDSSNLEELKTLFYSPLYSERFYSMSNDIFFGPLLGMHDDIEKLPKDDLSYLIRVGAAKDLSDEEILKLRRESKILDYQLARIAIASNQSNVLELLQREVGFDFERLYTGVASKLNFNTAIGLSGYIEILKFLKQDKSSKKLWAGFAAENGHVEMLKFLMEDKSWYDLSFLENLEMSAVQNGHIEMLKFLLETVNKYQGSEEYLNKSRVKLLKNAIENGYAEIVKLLIENIAQANYAELISVAIKDKQAEAVEIFIEKIIKSDYDPSQREWLLSLSIKHGCIKSTKSLIAAGADVNCKDSQGLSPLMIAAKNGRREIIELLLENGADVNYTITTECLESAGLTALKIAANNEYGKITKLLLEKKLEFIDDASQASELLIIAAQYDCDEAIEGLLKKGANVKYEDRKKNTALLAAVKNNHAKVAKLLLENGADINHRMQDGSGALQIINSSLELNREEMLDIILKNKIDISQDPTILDDILKKAIEYDKIEIIKILEESGVVKLSNDDILQIAIKHDAVKIVMALMEKEQNDNVKTKTIKGAAQQNCVKIVMALLEDASSSRKIDAIGAAMKKGHVLLVKDILESGVKISEGPNGLAGVLMRAAEKNYIEIAKLLLENGVDANFVAGNGETALKLAIEHGNVEVVKMLLDNETDVKKDLSSRYEALALAMQNGNPEIIEELGQFNINTAIKKEIRIYKGGLSGDFLSDVNQVEKFEMGLVGEIMNSDKLTQDLPYPVRARVGVNSSSRDIFTKILPNKAKNQNFQQEAIAQLQQNFDDRQLYCKENDSKVYFSFSSLIRAEEETQLLSVNYPVELLGIKVDDGVKITKLFLDEFGFYHVKTDKPCKVEYILEFDYDNLKTIDIANDPLGEIIVKYLKKISANAYQRVPEQEIYQTSGEYLEQIFETGVPAPCGLRVAAFIHIIKKHHPTLLKRCRIIDIERNHIALEVITGDNPNDFIYIDLGGVLAELQEVADDYGYDYEEDYDAEFRMERLPPESSWARKTKVLTRPFVAVRDVVAESLGKQGRYKLEDVGRGQDDGNSALAASDSDIATYIEEISQELSEVQEHRNITQTSSANKKSKALTQFIKSQNLPQFSKIKAANIDELFLQKQPSLLIANKEKSVSCANFLIEAVRRKNPNLPIFYINSPKQIDILKKVIKITGENSAEISKEGFLADFLQEAQIYNEENQSPLLIVNWSNFTDGQRTAFNSILDDQYPSLDEKSLAGIKVVSICDKKINDESFVSRHANQYWAEFGQKKESSKTDNLQDVVNIDLKGMDDWCQQLFGRIFLQDNKIIWKKSDFVLALEGGETNFSISNCSNVAEFNQLIDQAKAFGYFFYNGYKIPLKDELKIAIATKNFDFKQFSSEKNIIIKNKIIDQVSIECEIINQQVFDFLLRKKEISSQGEYLEKAGLIELASARADKILKLFITAELTKAQYYSLFYEANIIHHVNLELSFAVGVKIPDYLTHFVAENRQDLAPRKAIAAKIDLANNPRSAIVQSQFNVEVEDSLFQDLVGNISYKVSGNNFVFSEKKSEFIELMKSGHKICLRGEFSEDLWQMLQPLLTQDYAKNLHLIIENKDGKAFKFLEFIGKDNYSILENRPVINYLESVKESYKIHYDSLLNAGDEELMRDAKTFIEQREFNFKNLLQKSQILALYGSTGVGKTYLVRQNSDIYEGFENFEKWIECGGILFFDESNIINSHLTMFEALKKGGDGKIFYQGKFYQLNENHKVVFAYNPKEYGGSRAEQKLFLEGGVQIFEMQQLPASYIYFLLKTEVFDKAQFQNKDEILDEFLKFCKKEIIKYQDLLASDSKEKITIRSLQESASQFLMKIMDDRDVDRKVIDEKYPYIKNIVTENFVSTSATIAIENALGKRLAIREKQRKGQLPVCGTNGILIEGASGIGKSALIKAYLDDAARNGRKYYVIKSGMTYDKQKEIIIKAFRGGAILWIDEIDAYINNGIEKLLTSALSGFDPENGSSISLDSQNAGFMLVASSNGITQDGRSLIGPAIRSRLDCLRPSDLQEYQERDIAKIVTTWIVQNRQDKQLSEETIIEIKDLAKEYFEVQKSNKGSLNLRVLRRFIEENFFEAALNKDDTPKTSPRQSQRAKKMQHVSTGQTVC